MEILRPKKKHGPKTDTSAETKQDPNENEVAFAALGKFREIFESVRRHFRWVEERCGVSGAQLWVLYEVGKQPGLRVTELARQLAIHQTTASNLVDKLCRKALLERKRTDEDLRVVQLHLTQAGKAVLSKGPVPARGVLPDALMNLPASTLKRLNEDLGTLIELMKFRDEQAAGQPLSEVFSKRPATRRKRITAGEGKG